MASMFDEQLNKATVNQLSNLKHKLVNLENLLVTLKTNSVFQKNALVSEKMDNLNLDLELKLKQS